MHKLTYKDTKIHFTDNGDGQVLVLLHGYLESIDIWKDFVNELQGNYRLITIDLPGHGKTGMLADEHSMDLMADVVNAVLEDRNVIKCTMIGHSMGGYVTLAFAELYSEKLNGFGLFHSHPFADSEEKKQNRLREIGLIRQGKKELIFGISIPNLYANQNHEKLKSRIDFSMKIALGMQDEAIISSMKGMISRPDRLHLIEKTETPVLMIIGENDNLIPASTLKDIADNNKHISAVVLHNSGHMGFFEEPVKALNTIKDFMKNL